MPSRTLRERPLHRRRSLRPLRFVKAISFDHPLYLLLPSSPSVLSSSCSKLLECKQRWADQVRLWQGGSAPIGSFDRPPNTCMLAVRTYIGTRVKLDREIIVTWSSVRCITFQYASHNLNRCFQKMNQDLLGRLAMWRSSYLPETQDFRGRTVKQICEERPASPNRFRP